MGKFRPEAINKKDVMHVLTMAELILVNMKENEKDAEQRCVRLAIQCATIIEFCQQNGLAKLLDMRSKKMDIAIMSTMDEKDKSDKEKKKNKKKFKIL